MSHTRGEIAHGGELFLAAYFLFEDKHAFLGETLAGTGLAGALSIIKGQQTGKADEKRDTGKHGYVGSVLGLGDLERRHVHPKKDHGCGQGLRFYERNVMDTRRPGPGHEVAVDHETVRALHIEDAPAHGPLGIKLMDGGFVCLMPVDVQDFADTFGIGVGHDGAIRHDHGDERDIVAAGHFLKQDLQPDAGL